MNAEEIEQLVCEQRNYFKTGVTLSLNVRKNYLVQLKKTIFKYMNDIHQALYLDLGKSKDESYMCETGLVLSDLNYMIKHIYHFSKPHRVKTPLAHAISKSFMLPSPYGSVLIMSPWNYPFLLAMDPLIEALAAGNVILLKTSEYAIHTNLLIQKIVSEVFPKEYVSVVLGGYTENKALMEMPFDYVFFTGSKKVGRLVYEHQASFMTPVTLELGGKSPCIVDETADLSLAAKRIVWGKFLNCGQTCVAPDYILCDQRIEKALIEELKKQIEKQFGKTPLQNNQYGKIITEQHFQRLINLIEMKKVLFGGQSDLEKLKIEPTLLHQVTAQDAVMQEEIFGPILPILSYTNIEEAVQQISSLDAPLALYIFSKNKKRIKFFIQSIGFGGGCINDVVIHLATPHMPFGGFKESGLGSYHGQKGFETFSHYKSIMNKKTWLDLPMRYQPYRRFYSKLIRLFIR